jgi:hypothetical protein
MHAETHMGAVAEPYVRLALPENVEALGVVPPVVVMVRAAEIHRHRRTGGDVNAVEVDVASGLPYEVQKRGLPPDSFLDRLRESPAVSLHRCELIGMGQQRQSQAGRRT